MGKRKKSPRERQLRQGGRCKTIHKQCSIQIPEPQEKMQKIQELFRLAVEANGLGERRRGTTGNLPTVFVYYMGHISTMEVQIHPKGWAAEDVWEAKALDIKAEMDKFNEQYKEIRSWLLQYKGVAR